jgi:hypothetical protein
MKLSRGLAGKPVLKIPGISVRMPPRSRSDRLAVLEYPLEDQEVQPSQQQRVALSRLDIRL